MAHLTDPEEGWIIGEEDDWNWTWLRIIRLHNRISDINPCIEGAESSGSNVLRDPGFEDYPGLASSYVLGASGTGYTLDLTDSSGTISDNVGWFAADPVGGTQWSLITSGQESGSVGLECLNQELNGVYALGTRVCPVGRDSNWATGIASEGAVIDFSVRAKHTVISGGGTPQIHLLIETLDIDGNFLDQALSITSTSTSYATYSVNYTMQEFDRYFLARIKVASGGSRSWQIDDCVVAVT